MPNNTDIFRVLLKQYQKIRFFRKKVFEKNLSNFTENHTGIYRKLLLNTIRHALLKNFRKKISNQAICNESATPPAPHAEKKRKVWSSRSIVSQYCTPLHKHSKVRQSKSLVGDCSIHFFFILSPFIFALAKII